jgi:hypothetical protein
MLIIRVYSTVRKRHVPESGLLRDFALRRHEVTEERIETFHNEELRNLYSSSDILEVSK